MLKEGDILLSKDGTIGKIGYIDSLETHATVASGIFVIRNIKPEIISTTFIYYLLKSRLFKGFIAARTEGSVIPHLYQKDFMQFEFPLPSSDEMKAFENIKKFYDEQGVFFIGDITSGSYNDKLLFNDTGYHTNEKGTKLRTDWFIENILELDSIKNGINYEK